MMLLTFDLVFVTGHFEGQAIGHHPGQEVQIGFSPAVIGFSPGILHYSYVADFSPAAWMGFPL